MQHVKAISCFIISGLMALLLPLNVANSADTSNDYRAPKPMPSSQGNTNDIKQPVKRTPDKKKSSDKLSKEVEELTKKRPVPVNKIEAVLKSYAETFGCGFSFSKNNVVEYDLFKNGHPVFVAVFSTDAGCSGGSNMSRSFFAVLGERDMFHRDDILISPGLSNPAIESFGFPQYIDSLFVKNGQLWFTAKMHDFGKDALCCPSVTVKAKATLIKKELSVDPQKTIEVYYWQSSESF